MIESPELEIIKNSEFVCSRISDSGCEVKVWLTPCGRVFTTWTDKDLTFNLQMMREHSINELIKFCDRQPPKPIVSITGNNIIIEYN